MSTQVSPATANEAKFDQSINVDRVPELPERPTHPNTTYPNLPLTYTLDDNISTISIVRQQDTYSLPTLNESSDLFSNNSINYENLKTKLNSIKETIGNDSSNKSLQFWYDMIGDYSNQMIKDNRIEEIESNLVEGIPESVRALVYMKTLQVRFKLDSTGYENLLRKANQSVTAKSQQLFIDSLAVDESLKEILRIFNYYTNEVIINTTRLEAINNDTGIAPFDNSTDNLPPNNFVIHISKLISNIPNLNREELLSLLLKFNKLFVSLIKDEFFYKTNRSMEDLIPEVFTHITKQGINLINFYKKILFNFFNEQIEDVALLYKILDFVVFEGFDFIPRVLVAAFKENSEKLLSLEGDEVIKFLDSKELFKVIKEQDIAKILKIEPQIIKYENEYHLLHANSLNSNNNELTNLKEVNDDLIIKINELKQQLNSVRTTHSEILDQSGQFNTQLQDAKKTKLELTTLRDELQEKYGNLTMKENLKNTINANKDFSSRNSELEKNIAELKQIIDDKNNKLAKYNA